MSESTRRKFNRNLGIGMGLATAGSLFGGAPARRLKIGHTGITWGYKPEDAEAAIRDIAGLGYAGFESFGHILEWGESRGGLGRVLDSQMLPLISAYCPVNLTDADKRKDETAKIVRWGRLIRKCGGRVAVIGPNNVTRPGYDFSTAKPAIVATLNEMGKALADTGITGVLHQHTGTCVEVRDEVYAVLEAVDTRYVKFGPDVGQLAKGGADPLAVVKDFLSIIRHVHLKDFLGGPHWTGYCPLGQGKVNIPAVLGLLEKANDLQIAMVELDPSENPPLTPLETASRSKDYLAKLGYKFRS
jgi:inosose dehydratase